MIKQQKSNSSTLAKKPFASRQMLRLALVAGVVGSYAGPAFAQTDLTLPAFPADSTELSLPASQDTVLPSAFVETKLASPSTSQRVAMLLGIKKVASNCALPHSNPTITLPTFPSTEPCTPEQTCTPEKSCTPEQVAANSHAPTIFRSTSGKTDSTRTAPYTTSITLASADESLSEIEIPPTLIVPALAPVDEATEIESLDVSLADLKPASDLKPEDESTIESSEALNETLLDVEVPKSLVQHPLTPVQPLPTLNQDQPSTTIPPSVQTLSQLTPVQNEQPLPDIVRRSPAIQLHIGGGVGVQSTFSDEEQSEEQTQAAPANFSMSDANDSHPVTTGATTPGPKTLKVRIEGEPAQVVSRSIASSEAPATSQKKLSFDPASFSIGSTYTETQRSGIQSLGGQFTDGQNTSSSVASKPAASVPNLNTPNHPTQFNATQQAASQNNLSQAMESLTQLSQVPTQVSPTNTVSEQKPTIGERLEVGLHESTNVETTQPISGLSVEHPELCQVLKSGERSLSLVGLKAGQTRVALFTTGASGERKIEIREVIIAGTENRQADMNSLAAEISKSVRRMYPSSRIEVIAEDEGLAVQGYAGSEAEAKKIISLIRRTSLQPVVDRLATYK